MQVPTVVPNVSGGRPMTYQPTYLPQQGQQPPIVQQEFFLRIFNKEWHFFEGKYKIMGFLTFFCNTATIPGSKGIRQWPMNWCTFYIPNDHTKITPSTDYN